MKRADLLFLVVSFHVALLLATRGCKTKLCPSRMASSNVILPQDSINSRPRVGYLMGSCRVNSSSVGTSADNFSDGGKEFLSRYASQLKLYFDWSSGTKNPYRVDNKYKVLNYAKSRNLPAVVEYPSKFGVLHYSFVDAWKAKSTHRGLFIKPEWHDNYTNTI